MAAVVARAGAARIEARRLRVVSAETRVATRERTELGKTRLAATCATYVRMQQQRRRPLPGAWSDLPWLPPDDLLDLVLVPVTDAE